MIQAARVLFFLASITFYALQAAAIAAGLNAWFGWQSAWALVMSLIGLRIIPIPFAAGIAGVLGARYGWQWSWLISISLLAGTALLMTAIQAIVLGRAGLARSSSKWLDRLAGRTIPPSSHDDSSPAPATPNRLAAVSTAIFCVSLILLNGILISEAVRSVISRPPSDMASTMASKLEPQFRISLEKFRVRLNSTPEFMALLRTMTPEEATLKGVELKQRGLLKLSVPDLERRAHINLLMLNAADLSTCARFARPGTEGPDPLATSTYALLARQSPAVIDDWLDLVYRAILASLQQQPDHRPSQREIDASVQRVLATLPQAQQHAVRLVLESPATATDEQLCTGLKALTSASVAAPEPDRAVLVRALALR
ncbi:hypothetical protein [Achromobacter aegrifaciens]|uniref:hypothetical protein n=1 Tax=Achromobacter aegrifaciens TaxID=1287736 RepID=UPI003207A0D6